MRYVGSGRSGRSGSNNRLVSSNYDVLYRRRQIIEAGAGIAAVIAAQAATGAAGGFTTGYLESGFNGGSFTQNLEAGTINGGIGAAFGSGFGVAGALVGSLLERGTAAFGQSYATSEEWAGLLASRYGAENIDHINGDINYGSLDDLARPTGITATITRNMLDTGTDAAPEIQSPGWRGNGNEFNGARGHLLARQLGGSGTIPENLVTLQQNLANGVIMRDFETNVYIAVENGEAVTYSATPIYNGLNLVPQGIAIWAEGSEGFNLGVTVLNPAVW